jgi:hypothetical protein
VTTDQRVVAKQEIQEIESAKQAGAPYSHNRYQASDTNTKLREVQKGQMRERVSTFVLGAARSKSYEFDRNKVGILMIMTNQ